MTSPAKIKLSRVTNYPDLKSAVAGFNEAVLFVDLSPKECYERLRAKPQSHLSLHSIIKYFDTIKVGLQINCDSRDCFYPYRLMRWEKFCHALSQPFSGNEKKNGFISSSSHLHQISTVQPCHLSLLCDFIDGKILSDQDYVEIVSILGEEEIRLIYACSPLLSIVDLAQLRADNSIVNTSIETKSVTTEQVAHFTSSYPNVKKSMPSGSRLLSCFKKRKLDFTTDFSISSMLLECESYEALIPQLSAFSNSLLQSLVSILKKQSGHFSSRVYRSFNEFINHLNLESQELFFVIQSVYYLYDSLNKIDLIQDRRESKHFNLGECRSVIKNYVYSQDVVSFFKNVSSCILSHPDCNSFVCSYSCFYLGKIDSTLPLSVDISYEDKACYVYLHTKSFMHTTSAFKVPYLSVRFHSYSKSECNM